MRTIPTKLGLQVTKRRNLNGGIVEFGLTYKNAEHLKQGEHIAKLTQTNPRLRLGEYSPIITEPEANNC